MSVDVVFTVEVEALLGQGVNLVGADDALGAWDPCRGLAMERKYADLNCKQWTCCQTLRKNTSYSYRFFVCKEKQCSKASLQAGTECDLKALTVCKWETNIRSRQLTTNGMDDNVELPVAAFGWIEGTYNVGKGWLMDVCEVRIRLHSDPFYMWKAKHRAQQYSIKCLAMDYAVNDGVTTSVDDDSREGPLPCSLSDVFVSNLAHSDCRPTVQEPTGVLYSRGDYVIFRSQMTNLADVGFQMDFFVDETMCPRFVGSAHILPVRFKESRRYLKLPIIGCNHRPIGEITVDLLVVRPVPDLQLSMETSYQTQSKWKKTGNKTGNKTLDIGHRGMGASYSRMNVLKENTIASFSGAGEHGADFVEFDVVLSKDMKPVIYHDYSVQVSYSNKRNHDVKFQLFEIPVRSLTLSQLQSMKLFSAGEDKIVELTDEADPSENTDPFPTLERCLQVVDESMGFNIEIKYPQMDVNDVCEAENYIDVNKNLDHILQVVFAHAGSRKIVFSCFDPDTTVMLQMKQNKYPVMFLHQGQTRRWASYKDYRSNFFEHGMKFALSEQLLGMALHAEQVLQDTDLIHQIQGENLILFVWGDDTNNPNVIRKLRDLNVDGIIYDRIDCHKPEHQPEFELVSDDDEAIFQAIVSRDNGATVQISTESMVKY